MINNGQAHGKQLNPRGHCTGGRQLNPWDWTASSGNRGTKRKRTTANDCDDSEVNIVCVRTAEDRVKEASRASKSWVIGATLIINEDLECLGAGST